MRLAAQLPLYEGALRKRIEIQHAEDEKKNGGATSEQPQQKMTMQEALDKARADRGEAPPVDEGMKTLSSLDFDSQNPLFDYTTG